MRNLFNIIWYDIVWRINQNYQSRKKVVKKTKIWCGKGRHVSNSPHSKCFNPEIMLLLVCPICVVVGSWYLKNVHRFCTGRLARSMTPFYLELRIPTGARAILKCLSKYRFTRIILKHYYSNIIFYYFIFKYLNNLRFIL